MTATDLFAALVVEKFLAAMAETGFAKRENILAAMVGTVTTHEAIKEDCEVLGSVHEETK